MRYHVVLKKRAQGSIYDINVVRRPTNAIAARVGVYDKNRKVVLVNRVIFGIWLTKGARCSRSVSCLLIV